MDDLIKAYESLLLEKEALEKECAHLDIEYMREFGDEIEKLFLLKVESITLKKKIAYCVKKQYEGENINRYDLDHFIDGEIIDYQTKLQNLIDYNHECKEDCGKVTFDEGRDIKKIFRKIVHLIHPDLHPEFADDEIIQELWEKAVSSFKGNDYKSLVEAFDHIIIYVGEATISLDNVEDKINSLKEGIIEIKNNNPYKYKFLLDDNNEVEALHEEMAKEIKDYEEYKKSLEEELSKFNISEERCDA